MTIVFSRTTCFKFLRFALFFNIAIVSLVCSSFSLALAEEQPWIKQYLTNPANKQFESAAYEQGMRYFYDRATDSMQIVRKLFLEVEKNNHLNQQTRSLARAHAEFFQCMYHIAKNEYEKAQSFAQKAVSEYEVLKNFGYAFSAYNAYAAIFRASRNDSMTYHYFSKARITAEILNDSLKMAKSWNNLAMSFVERDQKGLFYKDSALFYYQKALNYTLLNGSTISKIQLINNVANYFTALKDYKKAAQYSKMAIGLIDSTSSIESIIASKLTLAHIYVKDNKNQEALSTVRQILPQIIKDSLFINFLSSALTVKIKAFRALNMPDSAYQAYEDFQKVKERMVKFSIQTEFNQLAVEYEVSKKEKENLELKSETQIQRILLLSLLLVFTIVCAFIGFLWYRSKAHARIAQEHQALEEERRISIENELMLAGQLLVNKNKTLLHLRSLLEENSLTSGNLRADIARVIEEIEKDIKTDGANDSMINQTKHLEDSLEFKLKEKFPHLTKNDLRLCAYIKLGFSSVEIAAFLNVTENSLMVRRSRLRAKLGLKEGEKLQSFLDSI